jgi:predicted nuclease of predicted toxin-antitoxin system
VRFLVDQDVYELTARHLRQSNHDVLEVAAIDLERGDDSELIAAAAHEQRIFLTRDRDFGALVFLRRQRCGVIYLRVKPSTVKSVHRELDEILRRYSEQQLQNAFVVVEPGQHRFRNLPEQKGA